MVKCEICGKEFETIGRLSSHIGRVHKNEITREEYYLKYIGEKGKCKECGKDTTFKSLNHGINKHDIAHIYCSEECKHSCILYHKTASALHNLINEDKNINYTPEEYSTWHEEVLYRQRVENNTDMNFCEYCHVTENLHVHHEVPQKIVPGYSLDPINGIILCEKCHYEIGHKSGTECSTGNLANKICK